VDNVEYAYERGLDEAAVAERLRTAETGVLSLARGGDAYGVVLGHHYDGDRLLFRLGETPDSEKRAFREATGRACYVVYGTEETDDHRGLASWSVVVTGTLSELPAEHDLSATAVNERFPPIRVFGEDPAEMDLALLELRIESATGRETVPP